MKEKISIPAFIFKPVFSTNITTENIRRQDDILDIDFPVFDKTEILKIVQELAMQKQKAHNRSIDDMMEVLSQVGNNWMNPNYEFRQEALRIIPMMTGQSRRLCELELDGSMQIYSKKAIETFLNYELGGKQYLEEWVKKGNFKLHAQPRGVLYHNLAGNTFNVGLISLYLGLISKNVNLIKLPHEEPYFSVRLAQSIADVDKNIAREMAVLYWSGSRGDIFNELFNSGNIDCIICWGGLRSIEDIRRRAFRYGIKIIDHGPKLSFSIISEEILHNPEKLHEAAQKIATDIVFWNQRACLSPRVIYLLEKPNDNSIYKDTNTKTNLQPDKPIDSPDAFEHLLKTGLKALTHSNNLKDQLFHTSMKRSAKLLRNEMSDFSPSGFARLMAEEMQKADTFLPRAHLTERDGIETVKKREYFTLKYEITKNGLMISPPNLNWTVMYLRTPPTMQEFQMCTDRFIIITRLANLQELVQMIKTQQLSQYLQTISLFGSDQFIEEAADDFSLLGACRFPRLGEHNIQDIGAPWDGHFVIQNMVRWCFIGLGPQGADQTLNLTKNIL